MSANSPSSHTSHQQVSIHLADRSYSIVIGSGLLDDPATYQNLPPANTALIVSNTTVAPLYAAQLQTALQHRAVRNDVAQGPVLQFRLPGKAQMARHSPG